MNTYLLIVATTFFAHSSHDPTVITFQEFSTKDRCERMAKWINDTYNPTPLVGANHIQTQCMPL